MRIIIKCPRTVVSPQLQTSWESDSPLRGRIHLRCSPAADHTFSLENSQRRKAERRQPSRSWQVLSEGAPLPLYGRGLHELDTPPTGIIEAAFIVWPSLPKTPGRTFVVAEQGEIILIKEHVRRFLLTAK